MENYNRVVKYSLNTCYYLGSKLHRIGGPAIEWNNGDKSWWQNGELHRIGNPAVKRVNGYEAWYQNGLEHRIDGPAIKRNDGTKFWYYEGKQIDCDSQEEFERLIKLKMFW